MKCPIQEIKMKRGYAAFYGEYEVTDPIGVYDTLEKAKKAVTDHDHRYNTEVIEYNLITGERLGLYIYYIQTKKWEKV